MRQKEKSKGVDKKAMISAPSWKKFFNPKAETISREESVRPCYSGELSSVNTGISTTSPPEAGSHSYETNTFNHQIQRKDVNVTPGKTKQQIARSDPQSYSNQQYIGSKGKKERNHRAKAILSRPFGRASVPQRPGRCNWVVEVSPAEWDGDQSRWKYRILVQRRQIQSHSEKTSETGIDSATSFTTAFTWRSLADFAWLEEALRAEYHGALLLPLLSIAIGTPDLASAQYEVDAGLLRDWLGDVLNGIRGQGEFLLHQDSVDLMASEALEAFLYRNTDPLPILASAKHLQSQSLLPSASSLDLPWKDSPEKEAQSASFVSSLWSKPFEVCASLDTLCTIAKPIAPHDSTDNKPRIQQISIEMMKANCSSRAFESTPSLEIQDSFVQYEQGELDSSTLAIQSQLVDAETELVESYRRSCLSAMERLRSLKEEEALVAGAWKRFAISFSNLYSYEKEVEGSRVGQAKEGKENMPYRKLNKSTVDELLRVLARQKLDRSVSSIVVIDNMLRAYVADLSAVGPSVKSYLEALSQLAQIDELPQQANAPKLCQKEEEPAWKGAIKALYGYIEISKHNSVRTVSTSSSEGDVISQKKAFENRVFSNERLLRDSLTALCRATPIRTARIAHQFLTSEETQATMLSAAAISLRNKINIADSESLDQIRLRHEQEIGLDDKTEISLVHRLLELGKHDMQKGKFSGTKGVGLHEKKEDGMIASHERVLQLAEKRLGKWDSQLALTLMEAIGIDDAEVQLEETTRELRLVRRHAIGLKENLSRCMDALTVLKSAILLGEHENIDSPALTTVSIREARREVFHRCALVFSGLMPDSGEQGQPKSASPSLSILENAGIMMNDPAGWSTRSSRSSSKTRCGAALLAYLDSRDADMETFLGELEVMLKDYKERVETIESFVYMLCVGIQVEKHFSKERASALAAFEKKTDIQTAINIAQRKRLPLLVQELRAKLEGFALEVTHTTVKESKEAHLVSKTLKGDIGALALRRFQRTKETAMDRIVSLMTSWATYEEVATRKELNLLRKCVAEVEKSLGCIDISADGLSHLIEEQKSTRGRSLEET